MFPTNNPMMQSYGQPQAQQPMAQSSWQVPPLNLPPQQNPAGQMPMGAMGANPLNPQQGAGGPLNMQMPPSAGQPGMPSMPSGPEQGDAMQRLLAEIRARQGQQQQPANNLRSMLGI